MSLRSIGDVTAELRGEFPDVTVSKIRYLEMRGLVRPQRTSGGQRRYDADDVALIRRILRLQRDEYLPLDVIAENISRGEATDEVASEGISVSRLRRSASRAMSEDEFCDRAGISAELLGELRRHGLLDSLTGDDLEVARAIKSLSEFGIEPRHLRPFRTSADRDVALVEQTLPQGISRGRGAGVAEHREQVARLLALLLDLHVALVRARSTTLDV